MRSSMMSAEHNEPLSKEYIDFERHNIEKTLFAKISEELDDVEGYLELAREACDVGDHSLKQIVLTLAGDEIKHYEQIDQYVKSKFGNMKDNPLYPLYENLSEWADDLKKELQEMR